MVSTALRADSTLDRWTLGALVTAAVWGSVFLTLGLLQLEFGHNRSFDLALYARSLWGVAHGLPMNPIRGQHALALHSHFVLYVLAPLAYWVSAPTLLLIAQAVALAAGGVVLHVIASRRLKSAALGFAVCIAYFVYPVAGNTALFDMHPKTLALPWLLLLLDRLDRLDRDRFDGISALLFGAAFACREEVGLVVAVTGFAMFASRAHRIRAATMMIVGLGSTLAYFVVLRPWLAADMASAEAHFGHLRWQDIASHLATADNFSYLAWTLGGLGLLPLGGLRFTLAAGVTLGMNMLSAIEGANQLTNHYAFLALPSLMLGAVACLERLQRDRPAWVFPATALLLCSAFVAYGFEGAGPGGRWFVGAAYASSDATDALDECILEMDDGPALGAVPVLARLSERENVFFAFRDTTPEALSHVLIEERPSPALAPTEGYLQHIAQRRAVANTLIAMHGFSRARSCGDYVWLRR